jgi:hypothetical protein
VCAHARLEELRALQSASGATEMEIDDASLRLLEQDADEGDDEARRKLAVMLVARWSNVLNQSFDSL